jgi:hypothetical protein
MAVDCNSNIFLVLLKVQAKRVPFTHLPLLKSNRMQLFFWQKFVRWRVRSFEERKRGELLTSSKITSSKISLSKTIEVDRKISDWSLCWNYLWHFLPMASKTPKPVGGAGSVRGWKNGMRGTLELLGDYRTDWGVVKC